MIKINNIRYIEIDNTNDYVIAIISPNDDYTYTYALLCEDIDNNLVFIPSGYQNNQIIKVCLKFKDKYDAYNYLCKNLHRIKFYSHEINERHKIKYIKLRLCRMYQTL